MEATGRTACLYGDNGVGVTTRNGMDEKLMQNRLVAIPRNKQHKFVAPNVTLWRWESDLVSVTKKGFVHEYEIKVSRGDFLDEMRKANGRPTYQCKWIRHANMRKRENCANYFWFVLVPGIADESEVPDYAGLILVPQGGPAYEHRRAKRLHWDPIKQEHKDAITQSLMWRYWDSRLPHGWFNQKTPQEGMNV